MTVRVRTISPRLRPKYPEAQTASNRRWAGGSDSVWGSAHWRAACLVPPTSTTSQGFPVRSNMPPGEANGFAGEQILLKKRAQGFHNALVKASRENGKESIGGVTGFDQRVP